MARQFTPDERLAIASECLRQLWQCFDTGGHSMGRSQESVLLESAMALIPYDHRYSEAADADCVAFDALHREAKYQANKERSDSHYRAMAILDATPTHPETKNG